jgi:hypothetical protein
VPWLRPILRAYTDSLSMVMVKLGVTIFSVLSVEEVNPSDERVA